MLALLLAGCGDGEPSQAPDPGIAPGIFGALGEVRPSATPEQQATFERGRAVQLRRFTPATGLGPQFNVTFCGACHERPVPGGSSARYRNFLLVGQKLSDGSFTPTGVNGIQDQYTLAEAGRVPDAENTNNRALRNAIPFFGVGLIAEIPEASILKYADPDDANHDGISGRPNYDRGFVGRFGRKSQTVSIEGFIRGPLFNHAGITTDPLPDSMKAELPVPSVAPPESDALSVSGDLGTVRQRQAAAPAEPTVDDDPVQDPELSADDLFDLVSFAMLLAAPRPDEPTAESEAGRDLFAESGCTGCHVPALRSPRGMIPLYSDLLLHDMGPERGDGVRMGEASGSEFRTQPLWGVGAVAPYLHDGVADTLDEAIRLHAGEAQAARDAYVALAQEDQQLIVTFLESLGGSAQTSAGLLPPDAPMLPVGDYGGPDRELSAPEKDQFLRGRAVFDRDITRGAGLGTAFNGDSCRACHFDPVIGGSGPSDVDVTRQGIIESGVFTAPSGGTMAHHQSLDPLRPDVDPKTNFFELRQTPPIFGFGLIDQIPDSAILAHADPTDADQDGIRGVAHELSDGRLGRLGWKANVPSVAEFARDGLSNEVGVTLADQPGLSFGFATDADAVADPEMGASDIDDLIFYMQHLAPPPRTHTNAALEAAGEQVFQSVGCAKCHVPELSTESGTPVPLYSDLLLHDVLPAGANGIVEGMAGMRAFRTSPLWGLAKSAPYMHDGRAFTVQDAILAHDGEAAKVRQAFEALPPADRDALIAFLKSL